MFRKLLFILLLALHLIGCTPTDKAALDQFNADAPTFITQPVGDCSLRPQRVRNIFKSSSLPWSFLFFNGFM